MKVKETGLYVHIGYILKTISISKNKNITHLQPKRTGVGSIFDSNKYKNMRC